MFRRRSIPGNAQENIPLLRFSIYTLSLNHDGYSSTKGVSRCHFLVMIDVADVQDDKRDPQVIGQ
jgi:hypothetical protein